MDPATFDTCLGCMACVTRLPRPGSVRPAARRRRQQVERQTRARRERSCARSFASFPHPGRLRPRPLLVLERSAPERVRARARRFPTLALRRAHLAPDVHSCATRSPLPRHARQGRKRGTVALLQGCVQRVYFGDVNRATLAVLSAEGFEVHAPRAPRCCGALAMHAGKEDDALPRARETIAALERFDTVVVNAAGCGSAMKEYGHLLREDPAWHERAERFAAKVRDVHEVLADVEPRAPRGRIERRVAYHDACHLAHAQGVPRAAARPAARDSWPGAPGAHGVEIGCGLGRILQSSRSQTPPTRSASARRDLLATAPPR
jgi:glycolate oxidase iron-sulfur subunit